MKLQVVLLAGLLAVLQVVQAIYPDDHWQFAKALTVDNFDTELQSAIDAGKTMMVRWIASEG